MSGGGANPPLLLLRSPLGDDTLPFQTGSLHAIAMVATERLSAPFEIVLTAVSTIAAIAPDTLLGQPITVTVRRRRGLDRLFNGVVRRVDLVGNAQRRRSEYRIELVPRLSLLDLRVDCRIFQRRTAVDIVRTILSDGGISATASFMISADVEDRGCRPCTPGKRRRPPLGLVSRLEWMLDRFGVDLTEHRRRLAEAEQRLPAYRQRRGQAFTFGEELRAKEDELDALEAALASNEPSGYGDDDAPEERRPRDVADQGNNGMTA